MLLAPDWICIHLSFCTFIDMHFGWKHNLFCGLSFWDWWSKFPARSIFIIPTCFLWYIKVKFSFIDKSKQNISPSLPFFSMAVWKPYIYAHRNTQSVQSVISLIYFHCCSTCICTPFSDKLTVKQVEDDSVQRMKWCLPQSWCIETTN